MRNIRPWCVSRQLWWGHRLPVWYCDACEETYVAESPPERCERCGGELRQDEDVLDTWFSSALWPFATLGWPERTPELEAFYPTDLLTTARDIIFLWVARMVMMGIEFAGDIPFSDVYVHPVIQAPDGRRMSKSLGTGIDPLEEIEVHGADALRFGLLAMSSTQDVRYSSERVKQGRDLANKLWNASRLVLLNAAEVEAWPRPSRPEDRWILSRLVRAVESVTSSLDSYDFAHAALDLYEFFWSELCDWYLEIVKPRLYDGDEDASANLLHVLGAVLALAHPLAPFVTEEVWGYMPGERDPLVISPYPVAEPSLVDSAAEAEVGGSIALVRRVRRWRDLVGVAPRVVLPARLAGESEPHEFVSRLARISLDGAGGEALATIGAVEILGTDEVDPAEVDRRVSERLAELRSEVARAEGKLANESFAAKAPADVVEAERSKLAAYRAELEELAG
jgi:valyl-tRNA synthetase